MATDQKHLELPWGSDKTIPLALPDGWRLKGVLKPRGPEKLPDFADELDRALKNPIGSPPLSEFARRGKTACIIIDDRTRPTPIKGLLPKVVEELNQAGLKDSDIKIIIGVGTHRAMTDTEIKKRIGDEMAGRFSPINHQYDNPDALVSVGHTPTHDIPVTFNKLVVEADTVVSLGCIQAHEFAGFGGGYKSIMPGVAGKEPIHHTHTVKFQRPERLSSAGMPRSRCRFKQAVDECGALLGNKVFIVDAVLDPVNLAAVVAGDPIKAHAAGAKIYADMAGIDLPGPADVVIVDSNPLDVDLRVSMKACFNAAVALKPGGLMITITAAPDGLGDLRIPHVPGWVKHLIQLTPLGLIRKLGPMLNPSPDQAAGTVSVMTIIKAAKAWLLMTTDTGQQRAFEGLGIRTFTDTKTLMAQAAGLKPDAEVLVFPHGGASFIAWD